MKSRLFISLFMISNCIFSQSKEYTKNYNYAKVTVNNKIKEAESLTSVTYNFQNISGDILLNLSGTYYLFNKCSADIKSSNFITASYISNNGNQTLIRRYNDGSIEFIIQDFKIYLK